MNHYVYILECGNGECGKLTYYTGYTNNIVRMILEHSKGKGAKYTRCRGLLKLVYYEIYDTKSKALKREANIKKLSRKNKLKLIETKTICL